MTKCGLVVALALLAGFALPATAASGRQEITATQVAAAIRAAGVNVSAGQVVLLTDVAAAANAPDLKVDSVRPWDSSRMIVRLECVYGQQCLPFVVAIRSTPAIESQVAALRAIASRTIAPRNIAFQAGLTAAASASGQRIEQLASASASRQPAVLRAGTSAILLLNGGHVHIRLFVVCLQSGIAGQTIRVAGKVNRRVYLATVGKDGILRGRL